MILPKEVCMPVVKLSDCERTDHEGHVHWVLKQGTTQGLNVGCVQVQEAHPTDQHPEEQLYYIRSGRGLVTIDGVDFEVEKDMVVYIPPNALHRVSPLPGPETLSYIFVTRLEVSR
jgi:mannose-6-phosphate isomerase-like protein (cupin superfamily)